MLKFISETDIKGRSPVRKIHEIMRFLLFLAQIFNMLIKVLKVYSLQYRVGKYRVLAIKLEYIYLV